MKDPAAFWDKHAEKYAASSIKDTASYEHTLERTAAHLEPRLRVVEIGCGTGSTALRLASGVRDYLGADISPKMVQIAAEKAIAAGVANLRFEVASTVQAVSGGADAVLAFNMLHLTDTMDADLAAIYESLPAGGLFISKTVCLNEPSIGPKRFAFSALIPVMQLLRMAPFVARFSFASLEERIKAAGFRIEEVGSFPAMSRFIVARKH